MSTIRILHGDCIERMATLPSGCVALVLTDLPYGTTYAKWDIVPSLPALWDQFERLLSPNGVVVLTASQPFTSTLVLSRSQWFRCEWIWDKCNAANFANANRQPMKVHENILVFAKSGSFVYNPQKTAGRINHKQGSSTVNRSETRLIHDRVADDLSGLKFPKSIQVFPKHSSQLRLHSTQKPVDLFEYLIRTYTNEGDTVLDCCAGSGTTGEAAIRCNRHAILIDSDQRCVDIMRNRIPAAVVVG